MGDGIHVSAGLPWLELIPWRKSAQFQMRSDVDILNPAFQAVPLVGREKDLNFLLGWLGGTGVAVTAFVGRGGTGKTRLALELLQTTPAGWDAGFLKAEEAERFIAHSNLASWSWQRPTLIVVDYAALLSQVLARWLSELADHTAAEHPLRILLLERHADPESGWYHDLAAGTWHGDAVRNLFSPLEPRLIAPLEEVHQRREVLVAGLKAAQSFRKETASVVLPHPGQDSWFDQRLAHPQWADPLLLLMAAVSGVTDGIHAALSLSRQDLAMRMALRETDRVKRSVVDLPGQGLLVHLYACITLCGGLTKEQAAGIAESEFGVLRKLYPGGPGEAVDDLARLLGAEEVLPSMTPDLLAEAFLLSTFRSSGVGVVKRMAHVAPERTAAVLIRTVQDFGNKEDRRPLEWIRALVEEGMSDAAILFSIEESLPMQSLSLRELALEVTALLIERLRQVDLGEQTSALHTYFARLLGSLANRQSDMGQRADALQSIAEAVCLYRALAEVNPDAFLPNLAAALNDEAILQSDMGQRTEALQSIAEAVRLRRTLAAANPEAFLPGLAMSLNNLANCQSGMGQRAAALESIAEAVRLYRALAEANPDAFLPDLAMALNNQANRQSEMGQRAAALESIAEAVRLYRAMAEANPDAFLPDLAGALNNQANLQSEMGLRDEALRSIAEAVRLYRALAEANPDAFLPDLAMSLNNQANRQSGMGQRAAALESIAEAVRLRRALAEANPDAFLPNLAMALNNQANRQSEMGQRAAALESIAEAVRLRRTLAETNPDAFLPDLAMSLSVFGDCSQTWSRLPKPVKPPPSRYSVLELRSLVSRMPTEV